MKRMKQLSSLMLLFAALFSCTSLMAQKKLEFTLEEAQQYGIAHSYQSQAAALEIEKSKHKVKEVISTGLPQINGSAKYQDFLELPVQLVPGEFFGGEPGEYIKLKFGTQQQMGAEIQASQMLFNGSYFVGLQASRVFLELSRNDREKTESEIKQMITQAYGNVLVTEKNSKILQQNMDNLKKNLVETKALYTSGFVEEQDKDQLELLLANAKNSHDQAIRQIDISRNQLKFAMGIEIDKTIELTDNLDDITQKDLGESYLTDDFDITSHIDYKVAATQKKARELAWKEKKSAYLPSLNAFYSYQQNSYSDDFDFFSGDANWFPTQVFGVNLKVPIFSSFGKRQQVQQAKIDFEKMEIVEKQVTQQIKVALENAKSAYTYALSSYQTSKQNLKLAERIFKKMQTKYEAGVSTSLELTQANTQLLDTQGNFINAAIQLINAKSNLDKALNK